MGPAPIDCQLPESVVLLAGAGGLPMLRAETARASAQVYLHGAHLTAWTPAGQRPVIWTSDHARFAAGKAIRGGIPICFPWFGPGREPGLAPPAHGFARIATWRLVDAQDDDGVLTLVLRLTRAEIADLAPAAWPHEFEATFTMRIGAELQVALEVRNTGDTELSFEEALHTYLAVEDVRATSIRGLEGAAYLDKAPGDGPEEAVQHGAIEPASETDRIYRSAATVLVSDGTRTIGVAKEGSADTVVWNPWTAKAAAMADFGDDEWTGMVCVESANVLDAAVELPPGRCHRLTTTYTVC